MKSIKSAARRRGCKTIFLLFSLSVLLMCVNSEAAFSASLTVAIRQINPDSAPQKITCVYHQKCAIQLKINGGQTTLDVNIQYIPSKMIFQFQSSEGYFYTAPKGSQKGWYSVFWAQNTPADSSTSGITLFRPTVSHPETARLLSIEQETAHNVVHTRVADLEIAAKSVP
jgi:hypothetical protein